MRLKRKIKVNNCGMCGREAIDGSGHWYIVKAVGLVCPMGWVERIKVGKWELSKLIDPDLGYFSYETAHLICSQHGGHDHHTIIILDSDSFWDYVRGM